MGACLIRERRFLPAVDLVYAHQVVEQPRRRLARHKDGSRSTLPESAMVITGRLSA